MIGIAILVAVATGALQAGSARQLVTRGNDAFGNGDLEQALSLYDEASVEIPEAAEIHFNRGVVHYKQEDYEKAVEALKAAALKSREPVLSSRAKFNLGNCSFRQAQRQRDSDLGKAIEYCRESISSYQEARDLDPEFKEAAENIEIVRLYVKVLLDEQKKQQEQQEQQQQQEENIAEKLKKLLERQNGLAGRSEVLNAEKPDPAAAGEAGQWKGELGKVAGEQSVLRDDTGSVLEEMQQMSSQARQQAAATPAQGQAAPQQQAGAEEFAKKLEAAASHVGDAIGKEGQAMELLKAEASGAALEQQRGAATDLEEAIKKLSDDQQQQQQQGGEDQQDQQEQQDQEQQGEQQDQQDQEQQDEQQEQQDQEQESEQQAQEEQQQREARAESAEDILDEEKKNQQERRPAVPVRGRPVDRDW